MKGANKKASGYPKARSHSCCFLLKSFWELFFVALQVTQAEIARRQALMGAVAKANPKKQSKKTEAGHQPWLAGKSPPWREKSWENPSKMGIQHSKPCLITRGYQKWQIVCVLSFEPFLQILVTGCVATKVGSKHQPPGGADDCCKISSHPRHKHRKQ